MEDLGKLFIVIIVLVGTIAFFWWLRMLFFNAVF